MDYAKYRITLIEAFYRFQLKEFLKTFRPNQPTIILLPGGMGSQLDRTWNPFPKEPNTFDETVWIDRHISDDDALKLEVDSAERDIGAFVIAGNGPLHFFGMTPYKDFLKFVTGKRWNVVVFGYDWRRPLAEAADLLRLFVKEFQASTKTVAGKDPLPQTTFVCHSLGGLVITTALRQSDFSSLAFKAIVTVATPFYGTSTHHERYYVGQDPLNKWYSKTAITRIIGSMPGPYSLLFLPKAVFDKYGTDLGLDSYPLTDSTLGTVTDPFSSDVATRWPKYVRDGGLKIGRAAMIEVAEPIASGVLKRFFNVRSMLDKKTPVALRWDDVDGGTFDPEKGKNPLHHVLGPGDGTVPFWSAFHVSAKNRIDLKTAKDHGNLLEHREVMEVVADIVTGARAPKGRKTVRRAPPKASAIRLDQVMRKAAISAKASTPLPPGLFDERVARALFSKLIW
jgi:hypothetical protein